MQKFYPASVSSAAKLCTLLLYRHTNYDDAVKLSSVVVSSGKLLQYQVQNILLLLWN